MLVGTAAWRGEVKGKVCKRGGKERLRYCDNNM
jgi:hypothetical protein